MATQEQINAVVDGIVQAFGGDVALFNAWLKRSKLETELAALVSAERKLRASYATETGEFNTALEANQAAQAAKEAEIDAL